MAQQQLSEPQRMPHCGCRAGYCRLGLWSMCPARNASQLATATEQHEAGGEDQVRGEWIAVHDAALSGLASVLGGRCGVGCGSFRQLLGVHGLEAAVVSGEHVLDIAPKNLADGRLRDSCPLGDLGLG
jgi:hypothetical protein